MGMVILWDTHRLPLPWGVVIGASLVAAVFDLRSRKIPNLLTGPLALAGLVWAAASGGLAGLGEAVLACLLLAAPFVLLFLFAGGGAGDAKMMGAIGAWLGIAHGAVVLVAVSLTGMLLAMALAVARKRLGRTAGVVAGVVRSAYVAVVLKTLPNSLAAATPLVEAKQTMPYGIAILCGVISAAVGVYLWNAH